VAARVGVARSHVVDLALDVRAADGASQRVTAPVSALVLAGYTGRDRAGVLAHIAELERAGVAPPSRVPSVFIVPPALATTAGRIDVAGARTSGEVEFVLVSSPSGRLVGVGSDHTDRALEAIDVDRAKAACPKVIGAQVWRYEDVAPHWDRIEIRSWSTQGGKRRTYQQGTLAAFLEVSRLLAELDAAGQADAPGRVLFGGTLPLLSGGFECGERFEAELRDPVLGRAIRVGYDIRVTA
jgi:hypothetical protein